jgi:branched-chain amino acid transport system permease protein
MEAYLIHLATLACIYIMMTMAFNLAVGFTGLLNLGHVGLMAIGAYTTAILTKMHDWPFALALLAAAALTAIVGGLLALPSKRIKGDYYALVTLGFLFVVQAVLINWTSLTRGTLGIPGIPRPAGFVAPDKFFFLTLAVTTIIFFFLYRVVKSPFGRALEAVRDDEEVAESLGKPVFKLKVLSMMISGAVVAIAGGFLGSFLQFIAPNVFWLDLLVWAIAAMMVGGLASMRGSIVGLLVLFLIAESLRFVELSSALAGPARLIIFVLALLLVVLFRPKGIMGRAELD